MENEEEINHTVEKSITVKQAAMLLGKSEQFVRVGLRNNRFLFRFCCTTKLTMDLSYITSIVLQLHW